MIRSKVKKSQNQFDSFAEKPDKRFKKDLPEDNCAHINIPNRRKGARDGDECTVELRMEDESEEFNYDDWVEEQIKKIREIENS